MGVEFNIIDEAMHNYLVASTVRETPIQQRLREYTLAHVEHGHMMSSPEQMQLLSFLIKLINARRAIEVGVFTGYGSLAIASALPNDGELIACDMALEWVKVGQPYWEEAGVASKIQVKIAPALDTLQALLDNNQAGRFDFIFIDADKINYSHYYELSLKLLRQNGLMVLDNALCMAKQIVHEQKKPASKAIYQLTQQMVDDDRVDVCMVGIASGMLFARKK